MGALCIVVINIAEAELIWARDIVVVLGYRTQVVCHQKYK